MAQAKELMATQLDALSRLNREGGSIKEGEKLLASLLDSLAAFEAHHRLALQRLSEQHDERA